MIVTERSWHRSLPKRRRGAGAITACAGTDGGRRAAQAEPLDGHCENDSIYLAHSASGSVEWVRYAIFSWTMGSYSQDD